MAAALISDMANIVTILPKDEGFSPERFGAIALCVRDFTLASRHRDSITVVGGVQGAGFEGIFYRPAPEPRWYENRTRAYARHCISVIKRARAKIAEIHNRPLLIKLIAPKVSARIVLHLHNDPQEMRGAKTPQERETLLDYCDGIFCVSEYIRGRFLEGLPEEAAHKIHVVHNGIAIPVGVPAKQNLILYAGRMTEGKGALLLAEALALALPQLPGWRAALIGSDRHSASETPSAHEAKVMQAMAQVPNAAMLGFLNHAETLSHFATAAIAVVPSAWGEPFGRTAIEAMAYGCAVISSGRGALSEVTGDAALVPETLTAQSLADVLIRLATDTALRIELQKKTRARASDFAIAKCSARLDNARGMVLTESLENAA